MNIPNIDLPRIVVVGCGFAGIKLVQKIKSDHYQVVLLDRNNYHTFQPLMYQVASSGLEPDSIVYPIRKVFKGKKNFHFRLAEVDRINTDLKQVQTNIGMLEYDYLVVATGAATNFFNNNSILQNAYTMKSLLESLELRSLILQNFEKALGSSDLKEREGYMNFVIVGGGATGVELAGALAELKLNVLPKDYPDLDIRQMQINVIEAADRVLSAMSHKASENSNKFLKELGVNVWLDTMVKEYDGHTVVTNKKNFNSKALIWTAGVKGAPITCADWKLNGNERILVDDYNKVIGHDHVFAIGDVACMESEAKGRGHAMLASVAGQQGKHLGMNLNRLAKK